MNIRSHLRIEDYAIVGNLHTAALVGCNGSVDWLCLPNFDSGACFAALLGKRDHGHWQLSPEGDYQVTRRYREGTLVLETDFETSEGTVRLIDAMILETDRADMVRIVQGLRGRVAMDLRLLIRFDYGSVVPWIQYREKEMVAIGGPDMVHMYSSIALKGDNLKTTAAFSIAEGNQVSFVLNWHPSYEKTPPPIDDPVRALEETTRSWQRWSAQSTYKGRWKEDVQRSLVTLKALTFAPTGGIVAAATTSLPELLGGQRNWDYRYCWLRDATFTLYALMTAGYVDEARAWREWLLRAVAGSSSTVRIMYGIRGERRLPEFELPWLPGYEGSAPVRIGNEASEQLQLDVFGEVMDVFHVGRKHHIEPLSSAWDLQVGLAEHLEQLWRQPDDGIWEVRGGRRHFTHSKIMAWVAFDRSVKAVERFGQEGPVDRWRALRDELHAEVCVKGFNPQLNSFVQYYGGDALDASLLMIPLVGFLPPSDPRVHGTVAAVERHLLRDGFVWRYDTGHDNVDGLPPGEGAFLACSFWLVDNLVLTGRQTEAEKLFERLLQIRNDVGLLAEEYDVDRRRQVGNFPQAFSHISMINSARNLSGAGGPAEQRTESSNGKSADLGISNPRSLSRKL